MAIHSNAMAQAMAKIFVARTKIAIFNDFPGRRIHFFTGYSRPGRFKGSGLGLFNYLPHSVLLLTWHAKNDGPRYIGSIAFNGATTVKQNNVL